MNKTLENKFSMYLAVQKICADNESVWTGIPACQDAILKFTNKIIAIEDARQIQENNPTGITQDKSLKRTIMANNAMFVKSAMQAFATDHNNNELYESVNYSLTDLLKPADTISRDRAMLIYNKAEAIATNLVSYGVTTITLTNLQTSITSFTDIMVTPRTARNTIKSATSTITNLFVDADLILKRQLDKFMIQFKLTDSAFYNTFINARQIINLGKGSQTIEITLNPSEVRTVQRVINGSMLKNTGATALRYCADKLPPCDAGDESAVMLQPGDSVDVNITEHFVTLTNTDTVRRGSFKVKVTSTIPVVISTR